MNRFLLTKHAEDRAPSGCGPQALWLAPHRVRIVARASPAGLQQNANLFLREPWETVTGGSQIR